MSLLLSGSAIVERLKQKCPSVCGNVFSTADLSEVEEAVQIAPALHVVLLSYRPVEHLPTGAARWEETWCVVAVVRNASRANRAQGQADAAASLLDETLRALSGWRYSIHPNGKSHGRMTVTNAPNPGFSPSHAYFPLAFTVICATHGADRPGTDAP